MRYIPAIISLLALAASASSRTEAGTDCSACLTQRQALDAQLASQKSQNDLLARNRAFLATLGPNDVSKSIKVKSNILIFMLRLETLKNNMEPVDAFIRSAACHPCWKGKGK